MEAFQQLKHLLTRAPVLAFPNFGCEFILETDASGVGLGAILAQEQEDGTVRPIAYASRTLQAHEKRYSATELEALGVVWAVKHFRDYLYGHKQSGNSESCLILSGEHLWPLCKIISKHHCITVTILRCSELYHINSHSMKGPLNRYTMEDEQPYQGNV